MVWVRKRIYVILRIFGAMNTCTGFKLGIEMVEDGSGAYKFENTPLKNLRFFILIRERKKEKKSEIILRTRDTTRIFDMFLHPSSGFCVYPLQASG